MQHAWATSGCRPRRFACSPHDAWRRYARHRFVPHGAEEPLGGLGGAFGVRRPLRFLAYRLGLDDAQVAELAAILNELKTERAQSAVDDRRSLMAFADAVAGEALDQAKVDEAVRQRVQSAERLQAAVARSLARIHALLDAEQRSRLAYLIRTGTLVL